MNPNMIFSIVLLLLLPPLLLHSQPPPHHPQLIPPSTAPYWGKFKALFSHALFHPNLDFRATRKEGEGEGGVKEAVVETLGKGKATVEESAKSAANLAKETAQKVKDTLSSENTHQHQEL